MPKTKKTAQPAETAPKQPSLWTRQRLRAAVQADMWRTMSAPPNPCPWVDTQLGISVNRHVRRAYAGRKKNRLDEIAADIAVAITLGRLDIVQKLQAEAAAINERIAHTGVDVKIPAALVDASGQRLSRAERRLAARTKARAHLWSQ